MLVTQMVRDRYICMHLVATSLAGVSDGPGNNETYSLIPQVLSVCLIDLSAIEYGSDSGGVWAGRFVQQLLSVRKLVGT
jgi:hypothetical protein